jgi:excisionase family DNA binding protein
MQSLADDFLTIAEAARIIHVAESTIRRWIREGELPAYRIGKRRVAVRREDLAGLIGPVKSSDESKENDTAEARGLPAVRRLTSEEQQRGMETVERLKQMQQTMLAERGGKPFSPGWKLINEARDERSRERG